MPFQLNGTTPTLAPYKQTWIDLMLGRDHTGLQIYSSIKNCLIEFDAADPTRMNQWQTLTNTGTSITSIALLNLDATSYVTYSNVGIGLEMTRPSFEAANVNTWSILVTGIVF